MQRGSQSHLVIRDNERKQLSVCMLVWFACFLCPNDDHIVFFVFSCLSRRLLYISFLQTHSNAVREPTHDFAGWLEPNIWSTQIWQVDEWWELTRWRKIDANETTQAIMLEQTEHHHYFIHENVCAKNWLRIDWWWDIRGKSHKDTTHRGLSVTTQSRGREASTSVGNASSVCLSLTTTSWACACLLCGSCLFLLLSFFTIEGDNNSRREKDNVHNKLNHIFSLCTYNWAHPNTASMRPRMSTKRRFPWPGEHRHLKM